MAGRAWTLAEQERVVELRVQGYTRAEIALKLDRSPSAVKHLLQKLDIRYRCRTCGEKKPADEFAWSPNRRGIPECRTCAAIPTPKAPPPPRRGWTDDELRLLVHLAAAGVPYRRIGERIGRSKRSVTMRLFELRRDRPERLSELLAGPPPALDPAPGPADAPEAAQALPEPLRDRMSIDELTGRIRRLRPGVYEADDGVLPTREQWVDILADPVTVGRLVRDIVQDTKRLDPDLPTRKGRLPLDFVRPDDVRRYTPELARLIGLDQADD